MSTPATPPAPDIPPAHNVLIPASNEVTLDGLAPELVEYAVHLAYIHWLLFGAPLIVRRGEAGILSSGAVEGSGKGLALTLWTLEDAEQLLFLHVIHYSAPAHKCVVFDYRGLKAQGYVIVEWHG
jgi:hypothetical protein